jgi:hypothetical protein
MHEFCRVATADGRFRKNGKYLRNLFMRHLLEKQ